MTMGKNYLTRKLGTGLRIPKVSAGTGRECHAPCPSGVDAVQAARFAIALRLYRNYRQTKGVACLP
jgi:hypothetical protein